MKYDRSTPPPPKSGQLLLGRLTRLSARADQRAKRRLAALTSVSQFEFEQRRAGYKLASAAVRLQLRIAARLDRERARVYRQARFDS